MSVAIRAMDTALPGERGIKGNILTGQEILNFLLGIKRYPLKWFFPSKLRKIQGFVKKLERIVGIEARNILNDPTVKFPNTYLAVEAGKRTLEKAGVNPKDVQGFIFASDTSDFVFPSPGIAAAKLLGTNPKQFINCTMACVSIADALINACTWMEKGLCDNVLILAGDVTSRLRLPRNRVEPFIFGDGFVGLYLEKGRSATETTLAEKGGFTFSNLSVDTSQADLFVHRHIYPSELKFLFNSGLLDNFQDNDTGLDLLGDIDSQELALLLNDFLHNTNDEVGEATKVILPQTGKQTIGNGICNFRDLTGVDITPFVIANGSFKRHGNIGAGAVPLAWYEGQESGEIKKSDSIIFAIAGVGGVKTVFKYDPKARVNDYFSNVKNTERPDYNALIVRELGGGAKRKRVISNGRPFTTIRTNGNNGSTDIFFEPVPGEIRDNHRMGNDKTGNDKASSDEQSTNDKALVPKPSSTDQSSSTKEGLLKTKLPV